MLPTGRLVIMMNAMIAWLTEQLHSGIFASGAALGFAGGAVAFFHRLLPRLSQFVFESLTVFVNVDSRSDAFDPLLLWLHDHPYAARCRRLDASLGEIRNQDEKLIFTPSVGDHLFWQSGRPVWLSRSRERAKSTIGSEKIETIRLTALGRNRNFLRRIIEDAVAKYGSTDNDEMSLYAVDQYFEWDRVGRTKKRKLSSVFMSDGIVESIFQDAQSFISSEDWHAERGIPWRRGYLLYGPPGTGKTSLVKALAGALGLGVAVIDLSRENLTDGTLASLLAGAPKKTVLLIEDIDSAFRERDGTNAAGITFSGLLNAIDGVMSQEGHLLFMTTNHIERLDPALIRPGRVDVRIETGLLDGKLARQMFLAFFPGMDGLARQFEAAFGDRQEAAATVQGHLLLHRDAPAAAIAAYQGQPERLRVGLPILSGDRQ